MLNVTDMEDLRLLLPFEPLTLCIPSTFIFSYGPFESHNPKNYT